MTAPAESARSVSLRELANVYFWIGISSFGGGLISWVHRETVERRKWLRDQEFLSGLALSQILPGPTMVNMTIYLGIQLRGAAGALASWSSLVLPPSLAIIAIYYLYLQFHEADVVHFALSGVAATAVGLNIATGIKVARRSKNVTALIIAAGVFAAVAILHWPMLWVVLGAAPLSLALAWRRNDDG
ncbi:MAG TPA: chromate transporter [Alphaproteobacteria bacterium]